MGFLVLVGIGSDRKFLVLFGLRKREYSQVINHTFNPEIEIVSQEVKYIVNPGSYEMVLGYTISSWITGITQFRIPFNWSGHRNVEITEQAGCRASVTRRRDLPDDILLLEFDEPIRKGERKELKSHLRTIDDPERPVRRMYSATIHHPITGSLKITVVFRPGAVPRTCVRKIYPTREAVRSIAGEDKPLKLRKVGDEVFGEWIIPRPRFRRRYHIEWK